MIKYEYFYRDEECSAYSAYDDNCICWNDEGTGPMDSERHNDNHTVVEWRIKNEEKS